MRLLSTIDFEKTATSSDCLSGTDYENPPVDGTFIIYACSTVNTATLETPQDAHQPGKTSLLRKRTDGIPSLRDDSKYIVRVQKGVRPIVVLGGTTGTVHFTVEYWV